MFISLFGSNFSFFPFTWFVHPPPNSIRLLFCCLSSSGWFWPLSLFLHLMSFFTPICYFKQKQGQKQNTPKCCLFICNLIEIQVLSWCLSKELCFVFVFAIKRNFYHNNDVNDSNVPNDYDYIILWYKKRETTEKKPRILSRRRDFSTKHSRKNILASSFSANSSNSRKHTHTHKQANNIIALLTHINKPIHQ